MKNQPEQPDLPVAERLVDAILCEAASRSDDDSEFVRQILTATVERTNVAPTPARSEPVRRTALSSVGLAAAVVFLLGVLLTLLPFGNKERQQSEIYLVVNYGASEPTDPSPSPGSIAGQPRIETKQVQDRIEVSISPFTVPAGQPFIASGPDPSLPDSAPRFPPSFSTFPEIVPQKNFLQIEANTIVEEKARITYSGNVAFLFNKMLVNADVLELELGSTSNGTRLLSAKKVTLHHAEGQNSPISHATVDSLRLDLITGELILEGVAEFSTWENGDLMVPSNQLVCLSEGGFRISPPEKLDTNPVKYANPLPRVKR